jgi:hypothetical protein
MLIIESIAYLNSIVWLIIPIRQFKTGFFLFFLVLGLLDLLAFTTFYTTKLNIEFLYLFGTVILLYPALFEMKKEYKLGLLSFFLIMAFIVVFYFPGSSIILQIVIHSIIFISFLRILVLYYSENRKLLVFHLVLVLYEFSLLLKFFVFLSEARVGPAYYYVTTAFQIIIGIIFLFINELNSSKLSV